MWSLQIPIIALIDIFLSETLHIKILHILLYTHYYTHYWRHTLLKTHIITHIVTHTFFSGIMKPGVDVLVGPGCPIDWLRVSTYGTYDFWTFFKFAFFQTMTSALLLFYFQFNNYILFYFHYLWLLVSVRPSYPLLTTTVVFLSEYSYLIIIGLHWNELYLFIWSLRQRH